MTITRKATSPAEAATATNANRQKVNGAYEQLNDQAPTATTTTTTTTKTTTSATVKLSKLLPGKSLKYEKLINQTAGEQQWRTMAMPATTTTAAMATATTTTTTGRERPSAASRVNAQEVQKSDQNATATIANGSHHHHQQQQHHRQQQQQQQQQQHTHNVLNAVLSTSTATATITTTASAQQTHASNFNNGSKYFGHGSRSGGDALLRLSPNTAHTNITSTSTNSTSVAIAMDKYESAFLSPTPRQDGNGSSHNNNNNNNNNHHYNSNTNNAMMLHDDEATNATTTATTTAATILSSLSANNSTHISSSSGGSGNNNNFAGGGSSSNSSSSSGSNNNNNNNNNSSSSSSSGNAITYKAKANNGASPANFNCKSTTSSVSATYLPLYAPVSATSTGLGGMGSSSSSSGSGHGVGIAGAAVVCNCCNLIARFCFGINVRRCVLALFAITVVTIFYYTHYVDTGVFVGFIQRDTHPAPLINCRMVSGKHSRDASPAPDHRSEARLRIDPKVLVFVETTYSSLGRDIAELLVYNRIKYKLEVAGKSLPVLTNMDKGRYGVIVFENLDKYLNMDKWNRELLDKYCREYTVGIVGFVSASEETLVAAQLRDFPLFVHTNLRLRDASLNPASSVLRLTRAGETAWGALPGDDWAVFQHNHTTYEPIEWAQRNTQDYPSDSVGQVQMPLTTVLQDRGQLDGIQRILFGSSLRFWLHRLVFLDALSFLSHGQLSLSLERMLLVDIDDIFVGEKGTRLRPDDVRALIATQKIIGGMVPGFKFNLGFSGKYFHHGTREENLGDDFLLQNVHEFNWFSHMWKHQQPHLYDNLTLLMTEMQLNYAFAKEHDIPTDSGYSISPHHSGVYPAHEVLYLAWKKVWNVRVTSTEEYPHLRPARLRRGFIHRNIMVLPRQTCGLFTHTMYIDRYPGGRDKLDESIQGGELFQTIVYNPINIFMTHMSNYGSDRLALYTFQSVIKFLQCWTNLKLASAPPVQLAEMYFRLHPEEVDPVWGNPCDDPRHKKIWSKNKNCDSLPKFLVIGPQKTGTTALYTFLSMHANVASNVPSPDTYEEIQFFNGNNYYRGLDWYMDFFPADMSNTTTPSQLTSVATASGGSRYMFEKSATYFDGEMVPKRAHALLPHVKIVSILISPAKRAYSWYQHQRAHGDIIANNYSFFQVITATDSAPKALKDLRNRCLNPGKYAQHLEHWLAYYPAQQLHIIDGEQLRLNPVDVMNELQRFLKIQPTFDYSNHLRYDVKKGFYCQIVSEKRNKCLGKSKGRQYPAMDERSAKLLQRYYLNHNTALVKLLKKLGSRPIPQWLKDDLSTGT